MPSSAKQYRKKLHGWLSYAFASEVFVVVSLTLFLPICLEQFARDNGFLLPDRIHPCSSLKISSAEKSQVLEQEARCVVKVGWVWIDSASFSLYIYSISVALQAITVISMGGIADHPSHRKRLLLTFATLGSIAATIFLFLPSSSPVWYLSALLAIFANVGFGASVVAMNAYIPALAQESPEVVRILDKLQTFKREPDLEDSDPNVDIDNASAPLLSDDGSASPQSEETIKKLKLLLEAEYHTELSRATSRISSFGIALGYGGGICLLIVALIPVTLLHGSTFSLRLAIGLSGIWWAVFSIPAALWLPGSGAYRRGVQHLTADDHDVPGRAVDYVEDDMEWNFWKEIIAAWIRLGNMLRWTEIKKLGNTFKYLAAWFLLSDGFTTITSTAILFGKTTLHMSPSALILVGVLTPTSGILGSLAWPFLQRRFAWTNLQVLVLLVIMASMIPAYGCLGFFFQGRTKFGGLTTQEEMFGLAVYFGSVYGAFQGYARAFYAELLPPGEEARWYGLFSITDKSSSFIGPLVVGLISDLTANIRYAFFFLVLMVWSAVPILMCVDVEQGRKDAQAYDYHSISNTVADNDINGVHII